MMMCEILKKAQGEIPLNSRTCYNHTSPLVFPMEYNECPGCGIEITQVTLNAD